MKRATKKRGAGRPALPEGAVKNVFAIRVSDADRAAFAAAAKRSGKTITEWARDALLDRAQRGAASGDEIRVHVDSEKRS